MSHAELETKQPHDTSAPEPETVLLASVARQLMTRRCVRIGGVSLPVRRTSRQYLRIVNFFANGHEYAAIEQNAAKPSYWAELARKGHQVVQFKDVGGDYAEDAAGGDSTPAHAKNRTRAGDPSGCGPRIVL